MEHSLPLCIGLLAGAAPRVDSLGKGTDSPQLVVRHPFPPHHLREHLIRDVIELRPCRPLVIETVPVDPLPRPMDTVTVYRPSPRDDVGVRGSHAIAVHSCLGRAPAVWCVHHHCCCPSLLNEDVRSCAGVAVVPHNFAGRSVDGRLWEGRGWCLLLRWRGRRWGRGHAVAVLPCRQRGEGGDSTKVEPPVRCECFECGKGVWGGYDEPHCALLEGEQHPLRRVHADGTVHPGEGVPVGVGEEAQLQTVALQGEEGVEGAALGPHPEGDTRRGERGDVTAEHQQPQRSNRHSHQAPPPLHRTPPASSNEVQRL
eukprot:Sspe_Gene.117646::Locus_109200_Transcript_1_1_Confidence_1.000_Length_1269::g.117646::m.117646